MNGITRTGRLGHVSGQAPVALVATFAFVLLCPGAKAQQNEWAWMRGSTNGVSEGFCGTLGVASSLNIPGIREAAVSWTDNQGNLWLFGGFGYDCETNLGNLNDLWKFSLQTNEWAWIAGAETEGQAGVYGTQGMPAAANTPGARGSSDAWTDGSGNLWLFGGSGADASGKLGYLNDLWKFNPATTEWTWMGGSSTIPSCSTGPGSCGKSGVYGMLRTAASGNIPGARSGAVNWTDSNGNFWLFGGGGFDGAGESGTLNDLWKYSPSSDEWTWMGGSSKLPACYPGASCGHGGVYGTKGTANPANSPGGRAGAVGWADANGNLWLFGGGGYDGTGTGGELNDLWVFSSSTNIWTWMGGSSTIPACSLPTTCGEQGVYGTYQTASAENMPGGRNSAVGWVDNKGNFWLFGGDGYGGLGNDGESGYLNDIWVFSPTLKMWAWMSGSASLGQIGSYGTLGKMSPGNAPGSRLAAAGWKVSAGSLWLFGGLGYDSSGGPGEMNDLWEFMPDADELPVAATPTFTPQAGTYSSVQRVTVAETTSDSAIYYTTDGSTPTIASTLYGGPISVLSTETIQAIAVASDHANSAVATAVYSLNLPAATPPSFSLPAGTYSKAQSLAITDAMANSIIYYTTDGNTPTVDSIPYSGPIIISSSETVEAIAVVPGYANSSAVSAAYILSTPLVAFNGWTWVSGSDVGNKTSVYGTKGIAAADNVPSGRAFANSWIDKSGNFWIFGGDGAYASSGFVSSFRLNDLWEFNRSLGKWAWIAGTNRAQQPGVYGIQGAAATVNKPGARQGAASWTDKNGNLWLFGGDGYDGAGTWGNLNDLWEFNPSIRMWKWVGGRKTVPTSCIFLNGDSAGYCGLPGVYGTRGIPAAANMPGSRYFATTFRDESGNLWLFGGVGDDSQGMPGWLNDLWKYDSATGKWAWMAGDTTVGSSYQARPGAYGTRGRPSSVNTPGGRYGATGWTDSQGNLWLFGGFGFDSAGNYCWLNDLWKFDALIGQWIWKSGTSLDGVFGGWTPGVEGQWMTPAPANTPSGRYGAVGWTDDSGHLWLFGGNGVYADPTVQNRADYLGNLNDLWMFDPSTNEWTWIDGLVSLPVSPYGYFYTPPGIYGTEGTPSITNLPGVRSGAIGWTDRGGRFWLFGGSGIDSEGNDGALNDLWVYQPGSTGLSPAAPPIFSRFAGKVKAGQTVTISDLTPGAQVYYSVGGSSLPVEYAGPLTVSSSETIVAIATASGHANSSPSSSAYMVPAAATPSFNPMPGEYTTAQTVFIADATPSALIYYTLDGTVPTNLSSMYKGPIALASSSIIEAAAFASGYTESATAAAVYTFWPIRDQNEWTWMSGPGAPDAPRIWGTLGNPSINDNPGSRNRSAYWTDAAGHFWFFGGYGYDAHGNNAYLNDLWEYMPSTNEWAWMGGDSVAPYGNDSGQPGIYGTRGAPANGNIPGGRDGPASWTDSNGNFWLFGGNGYDSAGSYSELNDLWMFKESTNQGTWLSGSQTAGNSFPANGYTFYAGASGVYGTLGQAAPGNTPGVRDGASTWVDSGGNLWLFGGHGIDPSLEVEYAFNDLWKYSASTREWTWMSGK